MVDTAPADPVFVGGTGRCGTTVLGELIGQHSSYAFIPWEIKFHCHPRGLGGLLRGETSLEAFLLYMRDHWFPRYVPVWSSDDYVAKWERLRGTEFPNPRVRFDLPRERFDSLLDDFADDYRGDPHGASRSLVRSLLDPVARRGGRRSWAETTPSNGKYANTLGDAFPEMKIVHVFRDGRDVASSRLSRNRRPLAPDGRGEFGRELRWWAKRLRLTDEAVRKLPPERALTLSFEGLVTTDRDASYRQLLDFLGVHDEPAMRGFFDTRLLPDAAHLGRWREDPHIGVKKATKMYERIVAELHEEGVTCVPILEDGALAGTSRPAA